MDVAVGLITEDRESNFPSGEIQRGRRRKER